LFTASNPIPVKQLLAQLGEIKHGTVRLALSSKDMRSLDELVSRIFLIKLNI
jgi:dihydrodipicolinate synthase/N-acetylneuraminate lyase